jgi:predicted MFS family arabinose efflux permease
VTATFAARTVARSRSFLLLRVYSPLAFAYLVSYFFRNVNAVVEAPLVAELGLTASSLGGLTSAYFASFAAFQLPLGLLLDRFGSRRVESALLLIAAIGALVFSQAQSIALLVVGRMLIGLGVSACLMAAFKAYAIFFDKSSLPLINGCHMLAGGIGALGATAPLQAALTVMDWRRVFLVVAGLTLVAAGLLFVAHPDPPTAHTNEKQTLREALRGLRQVSSARPFVRLVPICTLSQGTLLSFIGLWAKPWLRDVCGFAEVPAAQVLTIASVGFITGHFLLGALTTRLSRACASLTPTRIALALMGLFLLPQALLILETRETGLHTNSTRTLPEDPAEPPPTFGRISALLFAYSFLGTSGILTYAALSQQVQPSLAGRLNSAINFAVFSCAFLLQWGFGIVVEAFGSVSVPTDGSGTESVAMYRPGGYRVAISILLVAQATALGWALVLETRPCSRSMSFSHPRGRRPPTADQAVPPTSRCPPCEVKSTTGVGG